MPNLVHRDITVKECDGGDLVDRLGHEIRIDEAHIIEKEVECSEKEVECGEEDEIFFIFDKNSSTAVSSVGVKAPSATKVANLQRLSAMCPIISEK